MNSDSQRTNARAGTWLSGMPQWLTGIPDQVTVRNILLATDFSECSADALNFGLGIASRYRSQLHLFHCVAPEPYYLVGPDALWKTCDDARFELEQLVSDLRSQGRANDIEVKVTADAGDPAVILPKAIRDLDADLVVIGTHGRTGYRKMVLGSVAEIVMVEVSRPVLSVGPAASRTRIQEFGPENIVLVSEASMRSPTADSYASSLARKYGSQLSVVDVLENRSGRILAEVSQLKWWEADLANSVPDTTLTSPVQLAPEVTESDLILRVAHQTTADLIVLAVPGSHRFADRFISTNPYRVVCSAPCPVLTVRERRL